MVNCRLFGSKDDAGGPVTLGHDFSRRGQANEASDQAIIILDLLRGLRQGHPRRERERGPANYSLSFCGCRFVQSLVPVYNTI